MNPVSPIFAFDSLRSHYLDFSFLHCILFRLPLLLSCPFLSLHYPCILLALLSVSIVVSPISLSSLLLVLSLSRNLFLGLIQILLFSLSPLLPRIDKVRIFWTSSPPSSSPPHLRNKGLVLLRVRPTLEYPKQTTSSLHRPLLHFFQNRISSSDFFFFPTHPRHRIFFFLSSSFFSGVFFFSSLFTNSFVLLLLLFVYARDHKTTSQSHVVFFFFFFSLPCSCSGVFSRSC